MKIFAIICSKNAKKISFLHFIASNHKKTFHSQVLRMNASYNNCTKVHWNIEDNLTRKPKMIGWMLFQKMLAFINGSKNPIVLQFIATNYVAKMNQLWNFINIKNSNIRCIVGTT